MSSQQTSYMNEDEIDLRELFNIVWQKKIFILLFTSLVTIGAVVYAYNKTPIYEIKSNVQIGFIGKDLIVEPSTLIKTAKIMFNVEDKLQTNKKFLAEVVSISRNKKLKNFIEIKTQGISNEEALKKNKEVVSYVEKSIKIYRSVLYNNKTK